MLLENVGQMNDLSPKMREHLEKKIQGFGKQVLYKFDISSHNPDPERRDGEVLWPHLYTLDPRKFSVQDKFEDRAGKQKLKQIAIITEMNEENKATKFGKVQVKGRDKGVFRVDLETEEGKAFAMFMELHPKHKNGEFSDKSKHQVFTRVDENALATEKRKERSEKLKALNEAQSLSDKEVVQFADAMTWDSTESLEILRSKIEDMAENEPAYFNEMRSEGNRIVEVSSTLKRALDKNIIAFDSIEYKYHYTGNNQTIAVLQPVGDKSELQKMTDWIIGSGAAGDQAYNKIKSLLK